MLTDELAPLFKRDLEHLKREIMLFEDEEMLWSTAGAILNSPGNLCFHLCGNLRHYIGHVLGGTNYKRNRLHEFNGASVMKKDLAALIDLTIDEITLALSQLKEEQLRIVFPIQIFEIPMSTSHFLLHLYGHFSYHLGQINYYRRLI